MELVLKNGIEEVRTLWKYVDIHKLLYLFQNEKLYFTRLDKFEDPIEGLTLHGAHAKEFVRGSFGYEKNNELIGEQKSIVKQTLAFHNSIST